MRYMFGDYELDEHLYQLRRVGEVVEVEPKVFDLLVYLVQHQERVVSKDELLEQLWPGQVVSETALTQCIMAARKAVGDDGTRQHTIKTQHGRGYRFVAPLTTSPPLVSSQSSGASKEDEESHKANGKNHKAKVEETERETEKVPAPDAELRSQDSGLSPQHFPAFRFRRGLVLMVALLLIVTVLTVQYLSLPTPSTQPLIPNPSRCPTSLPLLFSLSSI